jgi:hypothetical protein
MMKALMAVFGCLLALNFALKCQHSRLNVREGSDMSMTSETCKNSSETYCVYAWGKDKNAKNESISFSYRGCYSDFEEMKDHYHDPGCPKGGSIINNAISGNMTCCKGDNCNSPASTYSFSAFLLVLSISALFYGFSC